MSVVFNNVLRRIFGMSRRTFMRIICNFVGNKKLGCLYERKLMCLNRNCGASNVKLIRLFQNLCTASSEVHSIFVINMMCMQMSVGTTKSRIALFCRDSAVVDAYNHSIFYNNINPYTFFYTMHIHMNKDIIIRCY